MKKLIPILFCFISLALYGQEPIDNTVNFRAEYKFFFKKDSTIRGYHSDVMHLDVCNSGHSMFYSRNEQYRDSLMNVYLLNGLDTYSIMEKTRPIPSGVEWALDKNMVEQQYTMSKVFIVQVVSCTQPLEIPQWQISRDTLTLNGVLCNKATAQIGGRTWDAWFAPSIPINEGPWLVWGLPGLVMQANERNGYFKFECTDYGTLASPVQIHLSILDKPRQRKVSLKEFIKSDILFEEDGDTYAELYLGVRSTYGDKMPLQKYIPLFSPKLAK